MSTAGSARLKAASERLFGVMARFTALVEERERERREAGGMDADAARASARAWALDYLETMTAGFCGQLDSIILARAATDAPRQTDD